MNISLDWLKDFIKIEETDQQLAEILTAVGLEVEGIINIGVEEGKLKGLKVGEVISCIPHPNADKLKLCSVSVGSSGKNEIICGAPNIMEGQKVVVALPGVSIYPTNGAPIKIQKAKIRGVESNGMICSEAELGISENHDGIMVLGQDSIVGEEFLKYYSSYRDTIFEIGLTPNRGDAASHLGVARDLKAFHNRPLIEQKKLRIEEKVKSKFSVRVNDGERCPRYAGIILGNLEVGESPAWLKNRLKAIGQTPINSVVDITNYIMHDLGQPLHAFDLDKINGNEIVVRVGKKGEKIITLDETERNVGPEDLMICDSENAMCFGGVFGGFNSGVSPSTTSIFLESACFSPISIRKTSLAHQLKTDSAYRFERGTDPDGVIPALLKAVNLFREIHDVEIMSEVFDINSGLFENRMIKVKKEKFWVNIGHAIDEQIVQNILLNLDFKILENTSSHWGIKVPSYRTEVLEEADIYEEVLRIYGFNKIPINDSIGTSFFAAMNGRHENEFLINSINFFTARGFWEVMNNSISNRVEQISGFPEFDQFGIELLNPLSKDLGYMRTTLLPGLLNNLQHNLNRKSENLRFIERGKTYQKEGKGYKEIDQFGLVMEGKKEMDNWIHPPEELGFHDLFQVVDDFIQSMGIGKIKVKNSGMKIFEDGGQELFLGDIKIGNMGLVSVEISKKWDLRNRVWYCELNIAELKKGISKNPARFFELSKFPVVRRDLSLVLDQAIAFQEVRKIAEKSCGSVLKMMNCFSIFKGKPLEEGQKSYAISMFFERDDRTFKDEEIDELMNGVINAYEKELKAIIRR